MDERARVPFEVAFLPLAIAILLVGCQPSAPPFECTDAIGCVEVGPDDPIKLGVLQVLSGDVQLFGRDNVRSIELALDDRGGKLLGHPIDLKTEDSLCSKEGGATAASKMVADPQIVGIIGPTCSGAAASAMEVMSEAGLVMISGSSSAPSLTSVGGERGSDWQPGFLRTAQNDALVGRAAATYAFEQLGVTRAATIDDGDPYTRGLADTFKRAFTELGEQVVLATAVNKGDTDMRPVLTSVAAAGPPEFLYYPVFTAECAFLTKQAKEVSGLENTQLAAADGCISDAAAEAPAPT